MSLYSNTKVIGCVAFILVFSYMSEALVIGDYADVNNINKITNSYTNKSYLNKGNWLNAQWNVGLSRYNNNNTWYNYYMEKNQDGTYKYPHIFDYTSSSSGPLTYHIWDEIKKDWTYHSIFNGALGGYDNYIYYYYPYVNYGYTIYLKGQSNTDMLFFSSRLMLLIIWLLLYIYIKVWLYTYRYSDTKRCVYCYIRLLRKNR